MTIRPLEHADLLQVKEFTDRAIGLGYFSSAELEGVYSQSMGGAPPVMCSFILVDSLNTVQGIRLAFPPGSWSKGKGSRLRPDLWREPIAAVGYFQSLFLSPEAQGEGWGPKFSEAAIEALKTLGARAIVTHAWRESPNNSSMRYLARFGFESVTTHKDYWIDVDYECTRDGKPCRCTAEEMIKYL